MPNSAALRRRLLWLAIGLCSIGCANKHLVDYSTVKPELNYTGRCTVAVAVHDVRSRVTSGRAEPTATGESRFMGKQAHLTTQSGRTLATITADAIVAELRDNGFEVSTVEVSHKLDRAEAKQTLLAAKTDYGFLLTINKWWSAIHKSSVLELDLALDVYDAEGKRIAGSSIAEEHRFGEDGKPLGGQSEEPTEWGEVPETPAAPKPEPTASDPPASDPDAFDSPNDTPPPASTGDKGPSGEEPVADDDSSAAEKETSAAENKPESEEQDPYELVLKYMLRTYEQRLSELLNNPEIPKKMERFDPVEVGSQAGPLTPQTTPLVDDVTDRLNPAPQPMQQ